MNIGMILDKPFPPDPRVENEAQTLMGGGHTIHLFCVQYSDKQPEFEIINEINVTRVRLPRLLYKLSALAYTVPIYHNSFRRSISEFIVKNNIEALHVHDMQIARGVFNVNNNFNLPVILDLHENRPEIMKYYAHVKSFLGKLLIYPKRWKKFEYKYINEASRVVVVTDEAKEYYLKEINTDENKYYVVPNSVRPAFYTSYKNDESIISKYKDRYIILYLGETGLRRGLETVIKSLEYLIPAIPEIKLLIVGQSKTDNILINLVDRRKLEAYVEFAGWQDFHLFQSFIQASDIGICPIHRNLHHDTTYANKLFQCMSFGKPIIVSNSTAQKNLVEKYECGLVFKDRDANEFAEKVLSLYQDKKYYDKLSRNAETAVRESLNWDILSNELIELYKEI